jgi:hypothetical protein
MLCSFGMEAGTEEINSNAGAVGPIRLTGRELAFAGECAELRSARTAEGGRPHAS